MFSLNKIFLFYLTLATTYTAYTMQNNSIYQYDEFWQTIEQELEKNNNQLHIAALHGNKEELEKLVNQDNINERATQYDLTPLMCAIASEKEECVKFLLEGKCDIMAITKDGDHCMHIAALYCSNDECAEIVHNAEKKLYKKNTLFLTANSMNGFEPLHYAAKNNKHIMLKWFIQVGASKKKRNTDGNTPLHIAVLYDSFECIVILLKKEPKLINRINIQDNFTPLHCAVQKNNTKILKLLIEKGADINATTEKNDHVMHIAAINNSVKCAEICYEKNKTLINRINYYTNGTPLHYATQQNHTDILKWLLEKRADINATTKLGNNVIHIAAKNNNFKMINTIIFSWMQKNKYPLILLFFLCKKHKISRISFLPKPIILIIADMVYNLEHVLYAKNNNNEMPHNLTTDIDCQKILNPSFR